MSILANSLLRLAESWASIRGRKKMVSVNEYEMTTRFVHPEKSSKDWTTERFEDANIYHADYSNPLELDIDPDEESESWVPDERVKLWMQLDLFSKAFNRGGTGLDMKTYLHAASVVLLLVIVFVLWASNGGS